MHSISVLFFRSPVFSELQGPIQDRYGIYQGWIQHLRVCILQALCSCEFVAKADRCLHPRGIIPPKARATVRLGGKFAGAQSLQDTNTGDVVSILDLCPIYPAWPLQLAENRRPKLRNRNRPHVSCTHPLGFLGAYDLKSKPALLCRG